MVELSVKSSTMAYIGKPMLLCTVWTSKTYNPDNFQAQMKSIWKMRKKFEIKVVAQNLFLVVFEEEEDLK